MTVFIATTLRAVQYDQEIFLEPQYYWIIKRYHDAFGSVILCSRLIHKEPTPGMFHASDVIDEFVSMSGYSSILLGKEDGKLRDGISRAELVICRFHSIAACRAAAFAKKIGKPVFAEVMGDAWDAYWNHGISGKLFAPYMLFETRKAIANADFALYVTESYLQRKYPCRCRSVGVSNVVVDPPTEQIKQKRQQRLTDFDRQKIMITTTGAVDVPYKGQEYVIRAIPILNQNGIRVEYRMIGGGSTEYLSQVARECGVSDQLRFLGRMPHENLLLELDETDIYIQPSLQEGLPRATVEAMSRGCPCIGACTGGLPELLPPKWIVRKKSPKAIAEAVMKMLADNEMEQASVTNFERASDFDSQRLAGIRSEYYDYVKRSLFC